MIKIAEVFAPHQVQLMKMVRQCGITDVVGVMDFRNGVNVPAENLPWSYMSLLRLKTSYNDAGFNVDVIESRPPMEKIKLGLPGRDQEIDSVLELIRNLGKLGITTWCYEWMPIFNWMRTSVAVPARGGALATGYDHELMRAAPLTEYGEVSEDTLWTNLKYFLEAVVPIAEGSGVRLAMHPDDPPISPIRGLGRIMRSIDNFQRLVDLVPSAVNGIALCQGNFTLMTDDLPAVIRRFGAQDKIFFVHFRDVRGTPEKFVETFHDDGKTDMVACMQAYCEIGYEGVCRPDHVPTMEGDNNDNPSYSSIGRLFAIGYLKGIRSAVYHA